MQAVDAPRLWLFHLQEWMFPTISIRFLLIFKIDLVETSFSFFLFTEYR